MKLFLDAISVGEELARGAAKVIPFVLVVVLAVVVVAMICRRKKK